MRPARSNVVLLMVLLAVFAGLASVVLLANENRNLNRLLIGFGFSPIASSLPAEISSAEDAAIPPEQIIFFPDRLMDPPVAVPQGAFRRTITKSRQNICAILQKDGWNGEQWQADDLENQLWSCGAEKLVAESSDPTSLAGSLFVMARGDGDDRVSSVRLKINFLNGNLSASVLKQAVSTSSDILKAIGWGDDPEIMRDLAQLRAFKVVGNGNMVSFFREDTDVPRYNFLIVSEQAGIAQNDNKAADNKHWLKSATPGK